MANDERSKNIMSDSAPSDDTAPSRIDGERIGRLIKLRPEYRERYIVLHRHVFPDVIEQIRIANIRNYSIFLRDGFLFAFNEYVGNDYQADMDAMARHPTVKDWWKLTDPMQQTLLPDDAEGWWASMDEIFHGGSKTVASQSAAHQASSRVLTEDAKEALSRAYAQRGDELDEAIRRAKVQNYSVYVWKNRLITYYEYVGNHLESDLQELRNRDVMQSLQETLDAHTLDDSSAAGSMEQVFYTP